MNDACGVYASQNTGCDVLNNLGKGRFTATVTSSETTTTTTLTTPVTIGPYHGVPGVGGPEA